MEENRSGIQIKVGTLKNRTFFVKNQQTALKRNLFVFDTILYNFRHFVKHIIITSYNNNNKKLIGIIAIIIIIITNRRTDEQINEQTNKQTSYTCQY